MGTQHGISINVVISTGSLEIVEQLLLLEIFYKAVIKVLAIGSLYRQALYITDFIGCSQQRIDLLVVIAPVASVLHHFNGIAQPARVQRFTVNGRRCEYIPVQ